MSLNLSTSFNLDQTFDNAMTLHKAGRLPEAEGIYRNILTVDPKHINSLHLLGVIALQVGHNEVAVELIGQAISLNKRNAEFHNNMGVALQRLGRPDEAREHFKHSVKLKPDYADAHNNLGLLAKQQGQFDEAERRYRRTLYIAPDHADAHYNLGIELAERGRFREAEEHCRRVVALKPDMAEAHHNLGLVLMWQDRIPDAVAAYRKALALKPRYGQAFTNLAIALATAEEFFAALAALRCAVAVEKTNEARSLTVQCIRQLRTAGEACAVRDLVEQALAEGWDRPAELASVSVALIGHQSAIGECAQRAMKAWPTLLSEEELAAGLAAAASDELLRCLLESTPVQNVALERFLTAARAALLRQAAGDAGSIAGDSAALAFFCALARQCFINEYVFIRGDDELEHAEELRERLAAALASGAPVSVLWPVAVAAYFPLDSLPGAERLLQRAQTDGWPEAVTALLAQQVAEPHEERELARDIPRLTEIEDSVSRIVQQQYEQNPYPRWVRTASGIIPMTVDHYFRKCFRSPLYRDLGRTDDIEILVAGGGTGRHPVETAQKFSGARALAVDLSLASLAYAKRKAREAGLTNLDFAQADILKLGSIGRSFDIIEASGVLHHMADPFAGWRVLISLLRPNGLMNLGFYSELARADVVEARRFIAERGYGRTADDIRRCRQELVHHNEFTPYRNLLGFNDFFSTSECRDLLFHVQEHRLTLPTIKGFLEENDLQFLGFVLPTQSGNAFRKRFPEDGAFADLDLWHIFETENPTTFGGMYQFWVQKREPVGSVCA